jgi:copper(I)-binding protein
MDRAVIRLLGGSNLRDNPGLSVRHGHIEAVFGRGLPAPARRPEDQKKGVNVLSPRVAPAGILLAAVTALSGCGSQNTTTPSAALESPAPAAATPAAAPESPELVAATPSAAASGLTITDPWVKTVKKGMTTAFGILVNSTGAAVTVVSATSPLAPMIELHEIADSGGKMVMRPKEGGFVIPARGTYRLQPGGDHIMLMGVTEEVKPGARIPFTLTLAGGGTVTFTAVGKDFAGAKEDYQPGMGDG